jgi:glycosyltransferase involved in cell wall biosynthesis
MSSNAGALPEVIGDGGIYFDPMDEEDICQKLELGINNEPLRERLICNGIERLKLYNWEKCIITLKKILADD